MPDFECERKNVNFGSPYLWNNKNNGRLPQLDSIDKVGLVLCFLTSKDPMYRLCASFGVFPSTLQVWLDFGLDVSLLVVRDPTRGEFEVRWQTVEERQQSSCCWKEFEDGVHYCEAFLVSQMAVACVCGKQSNPDVHSAYWEGFTQADEATNLFVWNFYGEVIHAGINFPGSWHDSRFAAASGVNNTMVMFKTLAGFALLTDSTFPCVGGNLSGKILRARKSNEMTGVSKQAYEQSINIVMDRCMPSERQSA